MVTAAQKKAAAAKKAEAVAAGKQIAQREPQRTALARNVDLPEGLSLVRNVTLPSLTSLKEHVPYYLAVADAMRDSKVKGKPNADGTQPAPATVCTVGDVTTGEQFTFLVPAAVKQSWEQEYPDGAYVGRCFRIMSLGKRDGKRHKDYSVMEVDASGLSAKARAQVS